MIAPKLSAQEPDAADMAQVQDGDDGGALAELMKRHVPALTRFLLRLLHDRTEATEVAHEAFVRVYQNRYRFDFRCAFSTWLYTIATNLARDRLRRRARQPEAVPLELWAAAEDEEPPSEPIHPAEVPGDRLLTEEWFMELNARLTELPEKLRMPLVLVAFEGESQAQIAAQLHCSLKTVEMRLYHARQRLRAHKLKPPPTWVAKQFRVAALK